MATLAENIPTEFLTFAQEAQSNRASFSDAKSWARVYARKFYHEVDDTPGFLPIYNTLLKIADAPATPAASFEENFDEEFEKALLSVEAYPDLDKWARAEANRMYHVFDRQTKWKQIYDTIFNTALEYIQRSSSSNAAPAPATFAEDGRPTDAEEKEGRHQLNVFLHKQFDLWWDAFVAEAEEDTAKKAPSAEHRFCLHSAKLLSKKTDLPVKELALIVGAWLHDQLAHMNE